METETDKQKAELGDPFAAYRLATKYQQRYYTLLKSSKLAAANGGVLSRDCIDNCANAHINARYYYFMAAALAKYTNRPKLRAHIYNKMMRYNI